MDKDNETGGARDARTHKHPERRPWSPDKDDGEDDLNQLRVGERPTASWQPYSQMIARTDFQLKPREFFGFVCFTEPDTMHIAQVVNKLGQRFSAITEAGRYGAGVKSIAVTVILTDPEGLGRAHRIRRPKFTSGVRAIKAHGLTVHIEDALEFTLRPQFATVRNAISESDVAAALLTEIPFARKELLKLTVPDFDGEALLSDLQTFLERASSRGVYEH